MAYDRYDRDERERGWRNDRGGDRDHRDHDRERGQHSGGNERGWFERAGEEISSWFGGSSDRDDRRDHYGREDHREYGRGREPMHRGGRDEHRRDEHSGNRGLFSGGGSSERDYNPSWRRALSGRDQERDYRPMAGDYGRGADYGRHDRPGMDRQREERSHREHGSRWGGERHADSEQFFAASGIPRRGYGQDAERSSYERSNSPWGRDEYRRTSFAGSREEGGSRDPQRGGNMDPHYGSWRDRHMSDLDRDYQDYRRERQSNFESDFAGWRERRGEKRAMMGGIRPHMEVVGNDGRHVGTVDKTAGNRLILTKSDPESGGRHHSISCSMIDRIEGDRVMLDCSADRARERWEDADHNRALFEREDQGEDGPHVLNRSFEGTYRR